MTGVAQKTLQSLVREARSPDTKTAIGLAILPEGFAAIGDILEPWMFAAAALGVTADIIRRAIKNYDNPKPPVTPIREHAPLMLFL